MKKLNRLLIMLLCLGIFLFTAHDGQAQKRKKNRGKSKTSLSKKLPAETLITFKHGQFKDCGDSLAIDNHRLMVGSLENDSTTCYFGNEEDVLWLYPATLYIKLNRARAIKEIEVMVNDNCRPGCTTANLYNIDGELMATASNQLTYEDESLSFTNPDDFGTLTITSYEGMVKKINIIYQ